MSFDRSDPAVKPFTRKWPFFTDFERRVRGKKLNGATVETDPLDPSNKVLFVARGNTGRNEDPTFGLEQCRKASFHIRRLQKNQQYVIDFDWSGAGWNELQDVILVFDD